MGSGGSQLRSRSSRPRMKRSFLSSLVCGASSSRTSPELEDISAELLLNSVVHCSSVTNEVQDSADGSLGMSGGEAGLTSPINETGSCSQQSSPVTEYASDDNGLGVVESSRREKILYQRRELVPPCQVSLDCPHDGSYRDSGTGAASTSSREQQRLASDGVSVSANKNIVNGIDNSVNNGLPTSIPDVMPPSTLCLQGTHCSHSEGVAVSDDVAERTLALNSNVDPAHDVPGLPVTFDSLGNESFLEALPSGMVIPNGERDLGDESLLHVDVVSISSNLSNMLSGGNADTTNHETRTNGRRLFLDAFSRRSSRRFINSPTFFATDDADDLGFHDRWLLDFSGNLFDDGGRADSGHLGSRIHRLNERRRHSRSEIWDRLRGSLDGSSRQSHCPTGLHPAGTCSCESLLMSEDSSTRASISRIVMLAEALFEVLDEIHRQPASLSLSMVSIPAPESVVNSLPLKSHKKVNVVETRHYDIEQCHICLAEYEERDKIRVLPCNHEFHMLCVDKWLKEIHGVCPLCRRDVGEGNSSISVSSSEIPSTQ